MNDAVNISNVHSKLGLNPQSWLSRVVKSYQSVRHRSTLTANYPEINSTNHNETQKENADNKTQKFYNVKVKYMKMDVALFEKGEKKIALCVVSYLIYGNIWVSLTV